MYILLYLPTVSNNFIEKKKAKNKLTISNGHCSITDLILSVALSSTIDLQLFNKI